MKERGILMKDAMVQGIIDGRKTQTRRDTKLNKINDAPDAWAIYDFGQDENFWVAFKNKMNRDILYIKCPYGEEGDRLWVRECHGWGKGGGNIIFRADGGWAMSPDFAKRALEGKKWTPGIHMFRKDSRLLLEILNIRVERAQDISEADAKAEGAKFHSSDVGNSGWRHDVSDGFVWSTAKESFRRLWLSINGKDSWNKNPWVWVIEFKKVIDA